MEKLEQQLNTLMAVQSDISNTRGATIEDCDRLNKTIITLQILINEKEKEIEAAATKAIRAAFV